MNKKRFALIAVLLITALALTACDGSVSLEELGIDQYANQNSRPDEIKVSDAAGLSLNSADAETAGTAGQGQEYKVKGAVTAVTAASIAINGQTFTVQTMEDLTKVFTTGKQYEVNYTLNTDGSITLKDVRGVGLSLSPAADALSGDLSQEIKITGEITEVTIHTITINGETFTVQTTEDLTTLITAGQQYELEYTLNADGTITLISFQIEDNVNNSSGGTDSIDDSDDDDMDDSSDDSNNDSSNNDDSSNNNSDNSSNNNDDNGDDIDEVDGTNNNN